MKDPFQEQLARERQSRTEWLESINKMGMSQTETSKFVGVERSHLIRMMAKHGVDFSRPGRPKPGTPPKQVIQDRAYRKCARAGMTIAEAAKALGKTTKTIRHAEKRLGVNFARSRVRTNKTVKITANPDAIKRAVETQAAIRQQQAKRFMADARQPHN
jgi:DNA-binding XRE family transcriptional regulator